MARAKPEPARPWRWMGAAACSAAAASACMGWIWAKAPKISLVFIVDCSLPHNK